MSPRELSRALPPWTHGTCANLGANSSNQGQPLQAGQFNQQDFSYTVDNLLSFDRTLASIRRVDVTGLYSIQHDRFTKDSLYATNLPYPNLWRSDALAQGEPRRRRDRGA